MPITKLHFNPKKFSVVKDKSTGRWFAVEINDTPLGEWKSREEEEIKCIPIFESGHLNEMASRPTLRKELDNNVFLPESMFSY